MKKTIKKIHEFLIVYHTVISLIYWILLFVIFYLTMDFKFHDGLSLLFLILFLLPFALFIDSYIYYYRHKLKFAKRAGTYYQLILSDSKNHQLEKNLFSKLVIPFTKSDSLTLEYSSYGFVVGFNHKMAYVHFMNYPIRFRFYYEKKILEKRSFDKSGFEEQPQQLLYSALLDLIEKLLSSSLVIEENKYGFKLLDSITGEVFYEIVKKESNRSKYLKKPKTRHTVILIQPKE